MAIKANTVAAVAMIDEKIAELSKRREALVEKIRAEEPSGTKIFEYKGVQYVLKATAKQNLDAKAFQADHPFDEFPQFYKTDPTFSAALVKGDEREAYLVPGTTALSISKAE